jgi:CHASE1-domain containing sensor protein
MARARDTGEAALSGKVRLVQETSEDVQAGVLLYLPYYESSNLPETVEERPLAGRLCLCALQNGRLRSRHPFAPSSVFWI